MIMTKEEVWDWYSADTDITKWRTGSDSDK